MVSFACGYHITIQEEVKLFNVKLIFYFFEVDWRYAAGGIP